jgi:hypothetical protein
MVACATDQARHDRMLDITGGDSAALIEITDAQDAILGLDEIDLLAIARLAIHRSRIAERNAHIPTDLPALWVTIGHPARAEALARAAPGPDGRTLINLVRYWLRPETWSAPRRWPAPLRSRSLRQRR